MSTKYPEQKKFKNSNNLYPNSNNNNEINEEEETNPIN